MKRIFFLSIFIITFVFATSCGDDDKYDSNYNPEQQITSENTSTNENNSGSTNETSLDGTTWQCTWTYKLSGYTVKNIDTYRFSKDSFSWTEVTSGGPAGRSTQTTSGTYIFDGTKITTFNNSTGKMGTLIYHGSYLEHTGTGRSFTKL